MINLFIHSTHERQVRYWPSCAASHSEKRTGGWLIDACQYRANDGEDDGEEGATDTAEGDEDDVMIVLAGFNL